MGCAQCDWKVVCIGVVSLECVVYQSDVSEIHLIICLLPDEVIGFNA
jgi:hypothetical protein